MLTGGFIGPFRFFTLEGNLSPQGPTLDNRTEPYEDGELYVEQGRHGPVCTLVGFIDLLGPGDPYTVMKAYADSVGKVYTVQFLRFITYVSYPGFQVVEPPIDITEENEKYMHPVSGGVQGGEYGLRSQWKLQYVFPQ